jgi:hypothetical protein
VADWREREREREGERTEFVKNKSSNKIDSEIEGKIYCGFNFLYSLAVR